MKPGKNWIFLTQCDNLSPISSDSLESLMKIHACFYERIVISDTPSLSNWKLYDIAARDKKLWIDSGLLVVALRDQYSSLVDLHKHSCEKKLFGLDPSPRIAQFFDTAPKVPINFSDLSTNYTNRIDKLLNNQQLLKDFGISEPMRERLTDTAINECNEKGFVTRDHIFALAKSLHESEAAIIRRSGTAYYWEGVPAVLDLTASIHRAEAAFDTDLLAESFRDSAVSTDSPETEEIEILEDCRNLQVADILNIRTLTTFIDLNSAIRNLPEYPKESEVEDIRRKYLNHLVKLRTFLGIKGFRRVLLNTWIDIHPRLKFFGLASSVLSFAIPPDAGIVGSMIGTLLDSVAFLNSPERILDKAGSTADKADSTLDEGGSVPDKAGNVPDKSEDGYKRQILPSSSNQKEKQFRVSSVSGNISHKAEQSNEKGAS